MNFRPFLDDNIVPVPKDLPEVTSFLDAPDVGYFDGTLGALADVGPKIGLQAASIGTEALAWLTDKTAANAAREAKDLGYFNGDPNAFAKQQTAQLEAGARSMRQAAATYYTPDPATTGAGAQFIHGVATELTKAVGAAFLGPQMGPLAYGALHAEEKSLELSDKGVDEETRADAFLASFAGGAIGMMIPARIGSTRVQSALAGAVANPAASVAEDWTVKTILDKADYSRLSGSMQPFDPVNLTIQAILGGAFGAIAGGNVRPRVKPEAEATAGEAAATPQEIRNAAPIEASLKKSAGKGAVVQEDIDVSGIKEALALRMSEEGVVLQNRDRSSKTSRAQMNAIASKPDYNRVSVSRQFSDGAPAVGYVDVPPTQLGRHEVVSASDGSKMDMQYAVVEASQLIPSNDISGNRIEAYGKVRRNQVIAGNGRVAGIQAAYQRGNADEYKAALIADADNIGIDRGVIEAMDQPVLIRKMEDKDAARPDVAMISNESGTAGLEVTEMAESDAKLIDLSQLPFDEDGGITNDTILAFAKMVTNPAMIVDKNGKPNAYARPRLLTAIFQRVYDNAVLTSLLSATDVSAQNVVNLLQRLAPTMMRLEDAGDLDFRRDLVDAVSEINQFKEANPSGRIEDLAKQQSIGRTPETQAFLDYLATIGNKVNEPAQVFTRLVDWVEVNKFNPEGMFANEADVATRADMIEEFGRLTGVPVEPSIIASVQGRVSYAQKIAKVNSTVKEKLSDLNKFDQQQLDDQASIHTNMVAKMAELAHMDPLDVAPKIRVADTVPDDSLLQAGNDVAQAKLREESEAWGRLVDGLERKPTQPVLMLNQTPLAMHRVGADFRELRAHPHVFDGIFPNDYRSSASHHSSALRGYLAEASARGNNVLTEADLVTLRQERPGFYQTNGDKAAGAYSPSKNAITLTPNADITTFVHETGHWWSINLFELSKNSRCDLSLRTDAKILLSKFNLKSADEYFALPKSDQEEIQETIASWLEEFMTTGRPRDEELRGVLERFKDWILGLYKDYHAHLNSRFKEQFGKDLPPLSAEVEELFERWMKRDDALSINAGQFRPSSAQVHAARYAQFENRIRMDQPTETHDMRQTDESLRTEARASEQMNNGEKVSVWAPIDVAAARAEQARLAENVGVKDGLKPDPKAALREGLPVHEIPTTEPAADLVLEDGGAELTPRAEASPDQMLANRQAELALQEHPDMIVDVDESTGTGITAEQFVAEVDAKADEADAFAAILQDGAMCVYKNGGIR